MTRYIQLIEKKNGKIVKNQQISLSEFVCNNIPDKKCESSFFPKITIWDVITRKATSKILVYSNTRYNNGIALGLRNAKIELFHNINKLINKDNIHTSKRKRKVILVS